MCTLNTGNLDNASKFLLAYERSSKSSNNEYGLSTFN